MIEAVSYIIYTLIGLMNPLRITFLSFVPNSMLASISISVIQSERSKGGTTNKTVFE